MWKDMYNKGLKYVYQLYKDKKLKTPEEVKEEFGLNFMRYNSIITAIPENWKLYFQGTSSMQFLPIPPHNYDRLQTVNNISSKIYRYINGDIQYINGKLQKWNQEVNMEMWDDIFKYGKAHKDLYSLTNIPKYRSFQYRLLQRGLITNIQLNKWSLIDNNLCTFCKRYKETVTHLICECEIVQKLCCEVYEWLEEEYGYDISSLNTSVEARLKNQMVFGKTNIINFICLIVKQYIYKQRCQKKELLFVGLKSSILHIKNIEKYIAVKNSKVDKHNRKWNCDVVLDRESEDIEYIDQYTNEYIFNM